MDAGRLLQAAGLAVATLAGISGIIEAHADAGSQATTWAMAVQSVFLLAFCAGFWHNTGSHPGERRWVPVAVLAVQIFAAIHVSQELLFLLAAEIPRIVRGRRAFVWGGGLAATIVVLSVAAVGLGDFTVSEGLAHVPRQTAIVLTVTGSLAWALFAFSAGYLIQQLEESRDATLWAKAQLEGSQHLLAETARIGERLRISRELHDSIGHHLMGLSISLEVAAETAQDGALKPIQRAQLVVRMLLAETRDVLSSLRAERFPTLRPALEELCRAMKRPACHLDVPDDLAVGPAAARTLFRCAQEALTNATRHSGAANLYLTIAKKDRRILFEARDDGRGAPRLVPGNGLRGMKERLSELGGDLQVEASAGQGVMLKGWVPSDEEAL